MTLYSVSCHAPGAHPLGSARCLDQRMDLATAMLDAVADEGPGLVVFPAGFFRAATNAQRDLLAAGMRERAARSRLATLFGVDVAPEGGWKRFPAAPECFAYACDGARPLLWPSLRVLASKGGALPRGRRINVDGRELGILIESELFSPRLRTQIGAPELVLVLSHGGMTERWRPALAALDKRAPVLVVGQVRAAHAQLELLGPRGWRREVVGAGAESTLYRYRRESPAQSSAMDEPAAKLTGSERVEAA